MVFITMRKSRGGAGFEEEDNEFLFALALRWEGSVGGGLESAALQERVVGLRVMGRGRQTKPAQWVSGGVIT